MNTIQAFCKMNNLDGEPNMWLVIGAGIFIVFLGMIILTIVLYIMSAIGKKRPAKKENTDISVDTATASVDDEGKDSKDSIDDGELYAVIAAAIAAYEAEHGRAPSIKAAQVKRVCKKYNQDRKNG